MTLILFRLLSQDTAKMTDCDCFAKNCKRQFATCKTDPLMSSAGSPPSPPVIFTDPPASPVEAVNIFSEMASLENEGASAEAATQPGLFIYEPEVIIREDQDVYKVRYEIDSQGVGGEDGGNCEPEVITIDDGNSAAAASPSILNLDNDEPEVITAADDADACNDTDAAGAKRPAVSPDECPAPPKKSKVECGRPDTPRPEPDVAMTEPDTPRLEQGYSDEDERSLQMYQEKLLRDSLAEARNTYVSLTDLLLYKLRRINFNSEMPRDMLACLKVLGTLNRLYRVANLELDRHREDDFGSELFDI